MVRILISYLLYLKRRRRDIIVDVEGSEAVIPARERIPGEDFDIGDTIRAVIVSVKSIEGQNAPAITLSRTSNGFLKALFVLEVSEIADGVVEIMGVARDPGARAKIAVRSHDDKIDPVGSCVGLRGTRVRNVVRELNGDPAVQGVQILGISHAAPLKDQS